VSAHMRLPDLATASAMGEILGSHSQSESGRRGRSEAFAHGLSQKSALVHLLTLWRPCGALARNNLGLTTDPADLVTSGLPGLVEVPVSGGCIRSDDRHGDAPRPLRTAPSRSRAEGSPVHGLIGTSPI
jgi:hypothetical protein